MKFNMKIPPYISNLAHNIFAHYGIISFVLAMTILIYCVYTIQSIMSSTSDEAYRVEQQQKNTRTSFDKATIEQVKQLRTTDDQSPIILPSGRINPFAE
jgi:hypothetical protein